MGPFNYNLCHPGGVTLKVGGSGFSSAPLMVSLTLIPYGYSYAEFLEVGCADETTEWSYRFGHYVSPGRHNNLQVRQFSHTIRG